MIKIDYQKDYSPEGLHLTLEKRTEEVRPWNIVVSDPKSAWVCIEIAHTHESMILPVFDIAAALPHLIERFGSERVQNLIHNVTLAIDEQYYHSGKGVVQEEWEEQVKKVALLHPQYSGIQYLPPKSIPNYGGLVFAR